MTTHTDYVLLHRQDPIGNDYRAEQLLRMIWDSKTMTTATQIAELKELADKVNKWQIGAIEENHRYKAMAAELADKCEPAANIHFDQAESWRIRYVHLVMTESKIEQCLEELFSRQCRGPKPPAPE